MRCQPCPICDYSTVLDRPFCVSCNCTMPPDVSMHKLPVNPSDVHRHGHSHITICRKCYDVVSRSYILAIMNHSLRQ